MNSTQYRDEVGGNSLDRMRLFLEDLRGMNERKVALNTRVRLKSPGVPTSSRVGVVTGFAPQRNRHGNQAVVVEFPRHPSDARKGPQRVFVKDPAWLLVAD